MTTPSKRYCLTVTTTHEIANEEGLEWTYQGFLRGFSKIELQALRDKKEMTIEDRIPNPDVVIRSTVKLEERP